MKNKVKVSVVIPVYDSEKFITNCLDSVLAQSYKNYEIICVNDGSKDNSQSIIENYIKKYKNKIKIINQTNQGSGAARNTGIDNSLGDYIVFVDSDDEINSEMLKKLYDNIEYYNSDIAVCGMQRIDEETNKILTNDMVNQKSECIDVNSENINKLLLVNPGPCNKIHKKILFEDAKFEEIPVVDDLMLMLKYFPKIRKISFVPEPLYYYKYRKNSSSNSLSYETFCKLQSYMINMKKKYIKLNLPNYYIEFIDKIAFIHIGISMMTKLSYRKNVHLNKEINLTKKYLDSNFNLWNKMPLFSALKSNNFRYYGLYFLSKLYRLNIFILFIYAYKFMNDVLKKDIKW